MTSTPLWRNRDFALLWSGQVVSTLGARISATAMPLLVLALTGSPADAGLVGAAATLPYLIGHLPAGPLVDRWDRRRVLLASEVTAALTLATVPVALWLEVLTVGHLAVAAFVHGLCFVFFGLAEAAALPLIVPPAQLHTAIARNEVRTRGAALAGGPLGGLLFGIDRALPFVVEALSYAVASVALLFLRRDLQDRTPEPPEPLWRAALTGLRWIWRHPLIRAASLLVAASNLIFQAIILVLVVRAQDGGASPAETGVMLGIYSGGGMLGAVAAGWLHRYFAPRTVIIGVNWAWAALLPLFLVTDAPLWLGTIGAATTFAGPLWNVVIVGYFASLVPNHLQGRVTSASKTLSWGVMPVGALVGGMLLSWVGAEGAVVVLSVVMLAVAVAATASPAVRGSRAVAEAASVADPTVGGSPGGRGSADGGTE
ncbi:MFS transporter [Catenuloplanes indicus]|uniref:MFS family permease n=1 Tax=Catenuloplanes indicus TaxID=137267 RepID=A0AAE3VVC9_9ACTN|nr:MFS transporter [Catenuloplanes indicus]MDQ0364506.1 MFS family permease [Catenuloplanes indicus]